MAAILVVDDDELVNTTVRLQLEAAGHTVNAARHGGEGLKALDRNTFDLVISDILMPEVEGFEFIRAIRGRGLSIPIIAITGGTFWAGTKRDLDLLDISVKLGATTMVRKPFTGRQLLAAVESCLRPPAN